MPNDSVIERAFALAKTGRFRSMRQIRNQLHVEGFTHNELTQFSLPSLRRQISALVATSIATSAQATDG